MNKYPIIAFSIISLLPLYAQAEDQEKKLSIGVGSYAFSLVYSDPAMGGDDKFSGTAISASYAIQDSVAVKGALYSLNQDITGVIDVSGVDLAIVGGGGLASKGIKLYGGVGVFNETWTVSGFSAEEKFSGIQFIAGIGYNWDAVSVDLSVALRGASDYADFLSRLGGTGTVVVPASALTISARF